MPLTIYQGLDEAHREPLDLEGYRQGRHGHGYRVNGASDSNVQVRSGVQQSVLRSLKQGEAWSGTGADSVQNP